MADLFKLILSPAVVKSCGRTDQAVLAAAFQANPFRAPFEVWESPLKVGQEPRFIGIANAPHSLTDTDVRRTCDGQPVAQPDAETP